MVSLGRHTQREMGGVAVYGLDRVEGARSGRQEEKALGDSSYVPAVNMSSWRGSRQSRG